MPEARGLRSVLDEAEQAAAAGDYPSAERSLREALHLQEDWLGPFHPDVANTLNNLAIVYEKAGKLADAEQSYRRAHAIANASLSRHHPFVATSRKNLRDFCKAHGLPMVPKPSPPVAGESKPHGTSFRGFVIAGLSVVAFIIVLIAARSWFSPNRQAEPPRRDATQTSTRSPRRTPEPRRKESIPSPKPTTSSRGNPAGAQKSGAPAAVLASPTVVDALLCTSLSTSDWRCDRVSGPVAPGAVFFYTRVKSANDTMVQHRWYRGDRVRQVVDLPIQANPGSGYRTYSRTTVNTESAGEWRVELRTKDGALLHEERFIVR